MAECQHINKLSTVVRQKDPTLQMMISRCGGTCVSGADPENQFETHVRIALSTKKHEESQSQYLSK